MNEYEEYEPISCDHCAQELDESSWQCSDRVGNTFCSHNCADDHGALYRQLGMTRPSWTSRGLSVRARSSSIGAYELAASLGLDAFGYDYSDKLLYDTWTAWQLEADDDADQVEPWSYPGDGTWPPITGSIYVLTK